MKSVISKAHSKVYSDLNTLSYQQLDRWGSHIPLWVSANTITSFRLSLVVPTAVLMSHGHTWLPCGLVLVNAGLDYADGAFARWEKQQPNRQVEAVSKPYLPSKKETSLQKNWGAYYDALADKLFAIPVWIAILIQNPENLLLQTIVASHAAVESFSAFTRTKAYYSNTSKASTVVTAQTVGKVKQTFSMLGTALALIPDAQSLGTAFLYGSFPLSLLSVRDKMKEDVLRKGVIVYVKSLEKDHLSKVVKVASLENAKILLCLPRDSPDDQLAVEILGDYIYGVTKVDEFNLRKFDELDGQVVYVDKPDEVDAELLKTGVVRPLSL